MATLFTRILSGDIPGTVVARTDDVAAIQDIDPQAPVHLLIVPTREIPSVNDIDDGDAALIGEMVLFAKDLAAERGLADDGYRLVFNCGTYGGQTVDHIHLHLLGGRQLQWPPG